MSVVAGGVAVGSAWMGQLTSKPDQPPPPTAVRAPETTVDPPPPSPAVAPVGTTLRRARELMAAMMLVHRSLRDAGIVVAGFGVNEQRSVFEVSLLANTPAARGMVLTALGARPTEVAFEEGELFRLLEHDTVSDSIASSPQERR